MQTAQAWYEAGGFPPGTFRHEHAGRGCSCSCAGCRGVHGTDHCRVSWLGCNV